MKIFVPALKDINPFFDEIMTHSKHTFVFDDFKNYKPSFKTVLIHWPEQLFKWKEPSVKDLLQLKEAIKLWKKNSKIVYVVHNLKKHSGMTPQFRELYKLIEMNSDIMVHFGEFSKVYMQIKYPKKKHVIIYHPLYKNSYKIHEKQYARKVLGIHENSVVILVPGKVRNMEERKMILKAYKSIHIENKVLLVSSMFTPDFRGRFFLKKQLKIDVNDFYLKIANIFYRKPSYYFNHNFLKEEQFSLMLSVADIILIPRKEILNSGNLFLGMTYRKIIIGPNKGNVSEVLKKLRMPLFNPSNAKSVQNALQSAIEICESNTYRYDEKFLEKYNPSVLAKQWDVLLS